MASSPISRRFGDRSTARRPRARLWAIEPLEGRRLLSTTYTVTSASDYVPGPKAVPIVDSLRWAVTQADLHTGSVIKFDIGKLGTAQAIDLLAPLPAITVPITIDGTSQLGPNSSSPGIVLNGSHAGSSSVGIELQASGSTLRGLVIQDFGGDGILLDGSGGDHGDVISSDDIGTDAAGSSAMGNGSGVVLEDGAYDNTIGGTSASARDVISGNLGDGVDLFSSARDNLVEGDSIGVDLSGEHGLGNGSIGVSMATASQNTIGGTTPGAGDVISGNGYIGIRIRDNSVTGGLLDNVVEGDDIGTDASGLVAIANLSNGITIDFGANGNTVGGTSAADRNVISGNASDGVYLSTGQSDEPVSDNVIQGNAIGTNARGTAVLPNKGNGVSISGASHNTISGNTISGNSQDGVLIEDAEPVITGQAVPKQFDSSDNVVQGNVVGGSSRAFGNLGDGIEIDSYSTGNTIGGSVAGAGNVISNDAGSGVFLAPDAGANNVIDYDVIESNGASGVYLDDTSAATIVENSTIELNAVYGIWMRHSVTLNTSTDAVTRNVEGQIVTTST